VYSMRGLGRDGRTPRPRHAQAARGEQPDREPRAARPAAARSPPATATSRRRRRRSRSGPAVSGGARRGSPAWPATIPPSTGRIRRRPASSAHSTARITMREPHRQRRSWAAPASADRGSARTVMPNALTKAAPPARRERQRADGERHHRRHSGAVPDGGSSDWKSSHSLTSRNAAGRHRQRADEEAGPVLAGADQAASGHVAAAGACATEPRRGTAGLEHAVSDAVERRQRQHAAAARAG